MSVRRGDSGEDIGRRGACIFPEESGTPSKMSLVGGAGDTKQKLGKQIQRQNFTPRSEGQGQQLFLNDY